MLQTFAARSRVAGGEGGGGGGRRVDSRRAHPLALIFLRREEESRVVQIKYAPPKYGEPESGGPGKKLLKRQCPFKKKKKKSVYGHPPPALPFLLLTVSALAAPDGVCFRSPAELRGCGRSERPGKPRGWRGGAPGSRGDVGTFSGTRRWAWDLEEGLEEGGYGRVRCSLSCLAGATRGDPQVCRPGVRSWAPRLVGGVCAPARGGRWCCGALHAHSE